MLSEEDGTNNGTSTVLTLRHTTTGTPAAGIGTRCLLQGESADESPADLGAIEVAFDDITSGSEDSTFYIWLRRAGNALSRAFAFRNTGNFQLLLTAALTAARTLTLPDATDTLVGKATTDTLTNKTLTDSLHNAGTGTETFRADGIINVDTTAGSTAANTTETTLITYSLPANSLDANGKGVRIRVTGQTANNANTKTVRLYFGTTVLFSNDITTAPNNQSWEFDAVVIRTSATTQKCISRGTVGVAPQTTTYTGAGETLTSGVTIKVTGQNGTAMASDITAQMMIVEYLNG